VQSVFLLLSILFSLSWKFFYSLYSHSNERYDNNLNNNRKMHNSMVTAITTKATNGGREGARKK
jgi:hypothetical protein